MRPRGYLVCMHGIRSSGISRCQMTSAYLIQYPRNSRTIGAGSPSNHEFYNVRPYFRLSNSISKSVFGQSPRMTRNSMIKEIFYSTCVCVCVYVCLCLCEGQNPGAKLGLVALVYASRLSEGQPGISALQHFGINYRTRTPVANHHFGTLDVGDHNSEYVYLRWLRRWLGKLILWRGDGVQGKRLTHVYNNSSQHGLNSTHFLFYNSELQSLS